MCFYYKYLIIERSHQILFMILLIAKGWANHMKAGGAKINEIISLSVSRLTVKEKKFQQPGQGETKFCSRSLVFHVAFWEEGEMKCLMLFSNDSVTDSSLRSEGHPIQLDSAGRTMAVTKDLQGQGQKARKRRREVFKISRRKTGSLPPELLYPPLINDIG